MSGVCLRLYVCETECVCCDVMCLTPVLSGRKAASRHISAGGSARLWDWLRWSHLVKVLSSGAVCVVYKPSVREGLALLQVSIAFTGCLLFFRAAT